MTAPLVEVIDFFSGCGGTSQGFQDAGMSIIAGIDNDVNAATTFRANFLDATFFERDIRDIEIAEVKKVISGNAPVLFSGCAPCQPFSKQNRQKKGVDDPRRSLLTEFQRFVVEIQPDFVVVENVPGLQRIGKNEGPLRTFISALEETSYDVWSGILSALDFGVPQLRRRLVLVAARRPTRAPVPEQTHGVGLETYSTVRDWIHGLPDLEAGGVDPDDPDHAALGLSALNQRRIAATPEGGGRDSWPPDLLLDCHKDHSGHKDVYGRLAWNRPASAMTTRCISYSNGRFGHPVKDRAISIREAACLQTFPRSFQFFGTMTSRGVQIGNAVPPLLARSIGDAVVDVASHIR